MHLTKSTTRALAASVVFVAAGATVAGAAVFQLPILGFGPANVASASASTPHVRPPVAAVPRKVAPKVVVKTRYVDDVVHRRAPERAYPAPTAPGANLAAAAPATRPIDPAPAMENSSTTAGPSSTTATPTTEWSEDGHEAAEHEREPDDGHSTDTVPGQAPVVDR